MKRLPELAVVVGFQDLFPAVRQPAVTRENAEAARAEVFTMHSGKAVEHASQSEGVFRAPPNFALDAHAQRGGAVHVAECPRLVLPVAPTEPRKEADVFANFLFKIQAKAIFETVV